MKSLGASHWVSVVSILSALGVSAASVRAEETAAPIAKPTAKRKKRKAKAKPAVAPGEEKADAPAAETAAPAAPKKSVDATDEQNVRGGPEINGPASTTAHEITPAAEQLNATDTQNNRMKTLEGSKSRWSGQFNLTYNASTISHPFSEDAPNSNGTVPPPKVNLIGPVSVRYRIDSQTTAGAGIGFYTETPFTGPKNTTFSDPYADIARSWNFGPIHDRLDFQATAYTSHEYHSDYGYVFGVSVTNEAFHEFDFGLTTGFLIEVDYNLFSGDDKYSGSDILANQTRWDLITDPYFEFTISKRVNLRTVIGLQSLNNRDLNSNFAFFHPKVYESLGVGVQILDAWFIYPFLEYFPYKVRADNTLVGFNTIINLF